MKENKEEGSKKPKPFRRVISDLEKSIQSEVHIGLKFYDEKFFNLLKDVLNKSHDYVEVRQESFQYERIKLNDEKQDIYHAFAKDMYGLLAEKAKRAKSQIIILYTKEKNDRLDIKAHYYKEMH